MPSTRRENSIAASIAAGCSITDCYTYTAKGGEGQSHGAVAAVALLLRHGFYFCAVGVCMGYAIGSKDDWLAKLSNENRDLREVIVDMECELQRGSPPGGSAAAALGGG